MELRVDTINTVFNSPSTPQFSGSGPFQMQIPQSSVMVAKPVSYEFRVREDVDSDGNVLKVTLQTKVWEHNNYGNGIVVQDWTDVPRIKVDVATGIPL